MARRHDNRERGVGGNRPVTLRDIRQRPRAVGKRLDWYAEPTLIGTGKATSTIRTGDLVEVDTYAHVVRVIQRADEP